MKKEWIDSKLKRIADKTRSGPTTLNYSGIEFQSFSNVYPTTELSELVVEAMDDDVFGVREGMRVLDYGSGTGFLAINAALRGANVVAVDVNPDAIKNIRHNAEQHGVSDRVETRESTNFMHIGEDEQFDIITAGLPWDDAPARSLLELSMYDPGYVMRKALFEHGLINLSPRGHILFTYAEFIQAEVPIEQSHAGYAYDIAVERVIKGEPHYAYRITPI